VVDLVLDDDGHVVQELGDHVDVLDLHDVLALGAQVSFEPIHVFDFFN
jgi:hypothetical protein